ncbi:MAG TPA: hypothetical protein VM791_04625 [Vicinamibacterales bacterium]|nr:hypothetical protein [Vicinamibacterales bacterium]
MSPGAIAWMAIFAVSAACFFVVAGVVSLLGIRDVKDLLRRHR